MAISPELDQHLEGMAQRYGVDPLIYRRLLGVESGTNPQSPDSPKGAVGIGQVMPDTFTDAQRALPHLKDIRDPFDNAEASAYYLRTMLDKFGNDYTKAVAAYNAGPGAVEKYGGIPPFAETQAHVKKVLTIGAEKTPSTWDKVSSYPRGVLAGAMGNLASIPKSFSIGPYAEQADISQARPLGSGKVFYTPQGRLVTQSQVEKAKQYLETAAHPEQGLGYRIGEAMMPDESKVLPGVKDSLGYNVARTLGQGIGMAGQYLATRKVAGVTPAMTGTTVSAMSQEESEMYKRGREQGKDPATSARAAAEASKLGWLDTAGAVPMLEMLLRYTPGGASKFTSSLVRLAAKHPRTTAGMLTAAEELATEIPQSLLEDEIAKKYFGEVTDAWKTAGETAAVTSISSWLLGATLTALGIKYKTGSWKLPKERSTTPITEDQDARTVTPPVEPTPSTEAPTTPTIPATPNLAQADVQEFGKLISGMEFQKRKEAQSFVDEMKGLRPSLQLEIVGKEITTKQGTKKQVAPFSVNVKSVLPFDAEAAMTAQPESTEYTGLPPHLVAPPSYTPQPGAGEVQAQKEQAMLRDLGVETPREGIPQPPETQVTPVPSAPNLATTKVPTHPIQKYLGQTHESLQFANLYAAKAKRETGITLYPHETEGGYVLRQARQGVYPVNTVARPSEMTPEEVKNMVVTPEGKTNHEVSMDMVAAMRAELEARKTAEQAPATQPPAAPAAPYSESERLAGRVTPETKADVTEQITRPGRRVEAPIREETTPESDPIIENAPKGMMARKLYLKRLGPGAKNYTVSKKGEIVKLYSFDPFSYLSDQNWTSKMALAVEKEPMLLYTLNPFALLNKKNVQGVRASVTSGLPRDDQLGKITEGYVDDTVGWLEKYVSQSQWLVKGNPTLEPIFRRVLDKQADFLKSFDESLRGLDTFRKLKKPDKMVVGRALWNVEGKDYAGQEITENKYIKNGEEIELNPAHYEQYLAWAKSQYPDDIASVMTDIRISLDQDLVNKWNRAVKPKRYTNKTLAELRHEVYDIPNYLPHSRYGDMVLEAFALDENGNEVKVYDGAFDLSTMPGIKGLNKKRFRRMVQDIVPMLEKNAQIKELGIVRWNYKLRPNIPSDMFENQPVLVKALDEVVSQAAGRLGPDLGGAVQAALPKAIADVMKSRGEWGHFAQRRGIAGYETDDLGKVLYDYKAGLYGLLSKADAAHDLSNMLFKLDKNKPNEYQWAVQFVKDALAPRSKLEDAMSTVKALGFLKYISGSLKTPIVNLSNMVNQGVPTLAQWTGPVADKYMLQSMVKAASILRGNTEAHTVGEVRLINELLQDGTLQAQYVKEVKRDIGRGMSGIDTRMGWVFDKLAYPMEVSERYSRSVTALAAYNAALDGKVNRPDLGLVKGKAIRTPSDEQFQALKAFAEEVTNDSHSIFGKVNRPAFARTGSMGKVIGSMYLFRHFTQNLLHLWTSMGKKAMRGDVNSAYGLVRGIAGNILLGGLAAGIPLMATFRKMYRDWLPKEAKVAGDDLLLTMKENLPDWAVYGVPALGGVNIGGSLSVDAPDSLEDILGVPVSMAKDLIRGKSAYDAGDYLKMTEAVIPIKVLRDALTAYRMMEEGQTTLTGRPVNVPGEIGPRKITSTEAHMQVLGFKPLSSQKAWDIQETVSSLEDVRKAKQSKLANQFATAMIKGDAATQRKVLDEVLDWNNYWIDKGKPIYLIDLNQAIKTRAFAEQPEKRSAQTALEAKGAFGF